MCVRSIQESALLHTPQYLGFIQTHPLGSVSTLAFTGWSQDTLCNCWSKVGRDRSVGDRQDDSLRLRSLSSSKTSQKKAKGKTFPEKMYLLNNCMEEWNRIWFILYACHTCIALRCYDKVNEKVIQGERIVLWRKGRGRAELLTSQCQTAANDTCGSGFLLLRTSRPPVCEMVLSA